MLLSFKYRLNPNRAQSAALAAMVGAFCDLYNAALQQRIEAYFRQGKTLLYADQANELKAVRTVDERLASFSYSAEQQVLRRLDKAFKAFFRRLKERGKAGFPRLQAKSRFDSAEFRVGDGLTIRRSKRLGIVGIPGEIKVKWHRNIPVGSKLGAAVLCRNADRWFVVFQVDVPTAETAQRVSHLVGVDVGLSALVALSTGETVPTPQWTTRAAKGLRRRQRALARTRRHSGGWRKARRAVARYQGRIANRRRDFLHKLSHRLANTFTHIALEDLRVAQLGRTMLAKAVHNAAWGQLIALTSYKAARAGGVVEKVNPCGTSQICSGCGCDVPKALAVRVHTCPHCGLVLDRDVNAARVILSRASFGPGTGLAAPSGRVAA
jgi:putative transposase